MKLLNILSRLFVNTGVDLTCSDDIDFSDNKYPCGEDAYGHIYGIFLAKAGQSITAAGTVPTAAELTTAMGLSTDAKLACIMPLYEATKTIEKVSIQGPDDLPEVIKERVRISGVVRNLADEVIDKFRQNNIRQRWQIWPVDSNGRLHGAKVGYKASLYFPDWEKEFGVATKAGIKIEIEYFRPLTTTVVSAVDLAYLDLNNA